MTKVGESYSGVWPEKPTRPVPGDWIRYPEAGTGVIRRAQVTWTGDGAVQLTLEDGRLDWCHVHQINADED